MQEGRRLLILGLIEDYERPRPKEIQVQKKFWDLGWLYEGVGGECEEPSVLDCFTSLFSPSSTLPAAAACRDGERHGDRERTSQPIPSHQTPSKATTH